MAYSRDAIDTLKGYYYQFDYFIWKLLTAANDDDVITLEGIEDVDINTASDTTAVQCKYYASTEYNHSKIAQPLRFMLKGYISHTGAPLKYKLYGFYKTGTDKLNLPLTVDFVKKHFLTYTSKKVVHEFHKEEGITDDQIEAFINNLEIDINAQSYEVQEKKVAEAIKAVFNLKGKPEHQVEFYYNSALGIVRQLCTEPDIAKRRISKKAFIDKLTSDASAIYDTWYLAKKGLDKYCKLIRSRYFSAYNVAPQKRFFLIDAKGASVHQVIKVLTQIKNKYSKFGIREATPFCPFVYLHNIADADKAKVCQALIDDHIVIKDGYDYMGASFNAQTLAANIKQDQRVDLKLLHSLDNMNEVYSVLKGTKLVYQFYIDSIFYDNPNVSDNIISITDITDVLSIL